jgi:2-dehydro-3-deoxyphosphogluconate aldolase/(4S)-4-hydroxy-2-oxoglutarate aldolase
MDETLHILSTARIVPVVVIDDVDRADDLAWSLVECGLPIAEITLRTSEAMGVILAMSRRGDIHVGAGTVTSTKHVDAAFEAGAKFIVSPGFSPSIVRRAQELGILVLPGVATATEILAAMDLGLGAVKFFPAQTSGGAPAIKALAAPFPEMAFVPTGGIGRDNLQEYLDLPSVIAVGGSWMVPRDLIKKGDFTAISSLCAEAVTLTQSR